MDQHQLASGFSFSQGFPTSQTRFTGCHSGRVSRGRFADGRLHTRSGAAVPHGMSLGAGVSGSMWFVSRVADDAAHLLRQAEVSSGAGRVGQRSTLGRLSACQRGSEFRDTLS